jgi:pimeloyl-ACP methyl ester carboxylesterase
VSVTIRVYYLPGITASFLSFDRFGAQPYYPDPVAMVTNHPLTAALDVDGVSPLPPFGKQLYPTSAYQFQELRAILQPQLPGGYTVTSFPYDWRLNPLSEARRLWAQLQQENDPNNQAILLCHSMGGLVGCLAYREAWLVGKDSVIDSVICLGSPLAGSYAVIKVAGQLLTGNFDNAFVSAFAASAPLIFFAGSQLARKVVFTWPGFLSLWPSLEGNAGVGDPNRSLCFDPSSFPDLPTVYMMGRLSDARSINHTVRVAVQIVEPLGKLLTICGTGAQTVNRLDAVVANVLPSSMRTTFDGDGLVANRASFSTYSHSSLRPYTHGQLPISCASDGTIARFITAANPVQPVAPLVQPPLPPPVPPESGSLSPGPTVAFPSEPFLSGESLMTLTPVTSLPLVTILNLLLPAVNRYTVLGFTGGNLATPYVRGQYKSQRLAWKAALSLLPLPAGVYTFGGAGWFYVPTSPPVPTIA